MPKEQWLREVSYVFTMMRWPNVSDGELNDRMDALAKNAPKGVDLSRTFRNFSRCMANRINDGVGF